MKQDTRHVFARAAQIIALRGKHAGDFVLDPFNQHLESPHHQRPMSVVGALNCAVTNDPRTPSNQSWAAIQQLAATVLVDGEPAWSGSIADCERHVEAWSDSVSTSHAVQTLRLVSGRVDLNSRSAVAA